MTDGSRVIVQFIAHETYHDHHWTIMRIGETMLADLYLWWFRMGIPKSPWLKKNRWHQKIALRKLVVELTPLAALGRNGKGPRTNDIAQFVQITCWILWLMDAYGKYNITINKTGGHHPNHAFIATSCWTSWILDLRTTNLFVEELRVEWMSRVDDSWYWTNKYVDFEWTKHWWDDNSLVALYKHGVKHSIFWIRPKFWPVPSSDLLMWCLDAQGLLIFQLWNVRHVVNSGAEKTCFFRWLLSNNLENVIWLLVFNP